MLLADEVMATVWRPSCDVISARQCSYRVRALSSGDDVTGKAARLWPWLRQRRVQLRRRLLAPGRRGVHRLSPASGRLPAPAGASRRLR